MPLKNRYDQSMKSHMRLVRTWLLLSALFGVFPLLAPEGAEAAWTGPCLSGTTKPTCHFWKGRVTFVADGDTIAVDVYGDGTTTPIRVRVTGINAMEQSVYSANPAKRRGECHAVAATARLERLIKLGGRVVRLAAQDPRSKAGHRWRRSVAVRLDAHWRDVGQILIDEGHVLWLPNRTEWAHNTRYNFGAQQAAAAGRRLWNTDYCGSGPNQATPLRMWVNWDADGTDGAGNLNGEWAKIKNLGTTDLPIGGWWFRDSWVKEYTFPSRAVVPAGGTITLYVGSRPSGDTNTATHFYWGRGGAMFENVNASRGVGDGGYLFDAQGDVRAWMMYACRYRCSDPLRGKIGVTAHQSSPEEVDVRNTSTTSVDLEGYVVENDPYVYSFGPNTVLDPGETLRLVVIGSRKNDTALVKYWGKDKYILNDAGDRVRLRTQTNISIDCYAWGSASC